MGLIQIALSSLANYKSPVHPEVNRVNGKHANCVRSRPGIVARFLALRGQCLPPSHIGFAVAILITSSWYSLPHLDQKSRSLQASSPLPPLPPVCGHGAPVLSAGSDEKNPASGWCIPFYVHAAPVQSSCPEVHYPRWLLGKFG